MVQSYTAAKTRDSKSIFNVIIITFSSLDCYDALQQDLETEGNSENKNTRLAGTEHRETKNFQKQSDLTLISDVAGLMQMFLGFRQTMKKCHAIRIVTYSSHSSIIFGSVTFTLNGSRISDN